MTRIPQEICGRRSDWPSKGNKGWGAHRCRKPWLLGRSSPDFLLNISLKLLMFDLILQIVNCWRTFFGNEMLSTQQVFWREQKLRRTRWTRLSSNPPWPSWLNNKQVPFFTLDKNLMETNKPLGLGDSIAQSSSSSWRTLLNLPKRPRDFGWDTFRKTIFLRRKMWQISVN